MSKTDELEYKLMLYDQAIDRLVDRLERLESLGERPREEKLRLKIEAEASRILKNREGGEQTWAVFSAIAAFITTLLGWINLFQTKVMHYHDPWLDFTVGAGGMVIIVCLIIWLLFRSNRYAEAERNVLLRA